MKRDLILEQVCVCGGGGGGGGGSIAVNCQSQSSKCTLSITTKQSAIHVYVDRICKEHLSEAENVFELSLPS